MTRISLLSSPLLLGFDEIERLIEKAARVSPEGYPPYNIERFAKGSGPEQLRITLAVAGFSKENLEITVEDRQLTIKGRLAEEASKDYLHRGIAGRQFQRAFVLADGVEVVDAVIGDGLLTINLERPEPKSVVRRIEIRG